MLRTKFNNDQLRIMEEEHRKNAKRGLRTMGWNKIPGKQAAENLQYITQQKALADVYAELLSYRTEDPDYNEPSN